MAYDKTQWSDNATALSAENMNHIEQGIKDAHDLIASVASVIYPVGSIYMSTVDTDPGTLFGGTWVPWGSGRVPVGVDAEDANFDDVEKEGGSSNPVLPSHTHTFRGIAMGNHNHSQNSHNHSQNSHNHSQGSHRHKAVHSGDSENARFLTTTSAPTFINDEGSALGGSGYYFPRLDRASWSRGAYTEYATASNVAATATNIATTATNIAASAGTPSGTNDYSGVADTSGKNLQPYITCYMYKRTA